MKYMSVVIAERQNSFDMITAQRMKFSINGFFSKCDQIHRKLRIWSHLLKKSLMENFIFCAVDVYVDNLQLKGSGSTHSNYWKVTVVLINNF